MAGPRVIVVGAGINGLCTAWALARRGADVTVLERGAVPEPRAASADHHRLIRGQYGDAGYAARMADAFAAWRALWAALPGAEHDYLAATGVIGVSAEQGDPADRAREGMQAAGAPFDQLSPAAAAVRFPAFDFSGARWVTVTEGGALMAGRILTDLAAALRARGVDVRERCPVAAIDAGAGEVELEDGRRMQADAVLVAAGVGARALAPELAQDLAVRRTLVLWVRPPADVAADWAEAPCWTGLGAPGDLWGMPPVKGLPAKLGAGALGRWVEDDGDRVMRAAEMEAMRELYVGRLRGVERAEILWGQANCWVGAPEERFVLRRDQALWLLSADSGRGFKFGALTGEDAAGAILGETTEADAARRLAALPA